MKKQPFPTHENSPLECVAPVEASKSDEGQHIPLTSAYPEMSSSSQKATSPQGIEASLLLSDPNIPKSTYDSSSGRTTGQPNFTSRDIPSGQPSMGLSGQLISAYLKSGLKLPPEPDALIYSQAMVGLDGLPYKGMTEHRLGALDKQVGGTHYKDLSIQPVEFIHKNGIGFIEGCIIKYICRWRTKGGVQDLYKVKHYAEMLIELASADK